MCQNPCYIVPSPIVPLYHIWKTSVKGFMHDKISKLDKMSVITIFWHRAKISITGIKPLLYLFTEPTLKMCQCIYALSQNLMKNVHNCQILAWSPNLFYMYQAPMVRFWRKSVQILVRSHSGQVHRWTDRCTSLIF